MCGGSRSDSPAGSSDLGPLQTVVHGYQTVQLKGHETTGKAEAPSGLAEHLSRWTSHGVFDAGLNELGLFTNYADVSLQSVRYLPKSTTVVGNGALLLLLGSLLSPPRVFY